jgi:general nucleoside transport system ATP-binding protein
MERALGVPSGTVWLVTPRAPKLALTSITRRYGPVTALDGASLIASAGEVHALLGENGAGKSTLMKVAYGLDRADAGAIEVNGKPVTIRSPRDAMAHGIGMVQQHFTLVAAMTVAENVALGGTGTLRLGDVAEQINRISKDAGLPIDPAALAGSLGVGAQQRLEIIKALVRQTETLILDEPTAVLSPREVVELLAWIRRFAEGGGTVILIAHKLREILSIADRVTVLRRGRTVLTDDARNVTESLLADAMLGAPNNKTPAMTPALMHSGTTGRTVLKLANVSATDSAGVTRLMNANLSVAGGEILGIAAVEGSGQHELLRVLAGRARPTEGTATIPADVGFVPEDRQRDAVVMDATLSENFALKDAEHRRGLIDWNAIETSTQQLMTSRDVRGGSTEAAMRTLSGGNQQKFVLGRELADAPSALIAENPTRGLDIRATRAVHAALRAARSSGTAVVVYSSDLDEVLSLSNRIVVVAGGRILDVLPDRDSVGRAMLTAAP